MRGRRGSNQHRHRPKSHWVKYLSGYLASILVLAFAVQFTRAEAAETQPIISPLPSTEESEGDVGQATPEDLIRQEIWEVFGEWAPEAFQILECENKGLDPEAIGTNENGSTDHGIFQINSYWHGFNKQVNNPRYLHDSSINIRMAWRIFEGSGYSWNLWACSSKVGL